jgi:Protein of unknown function (DUF3040)
MMVRGAAENSMSLPSREQRILDAIEYHLRVSDPALVSSFARLARSRRGGWVRALRRWGHRLLARRPRTFGARRSLGGTPALAFVPVFMLAVLSVVILLMPGHQQRACQPSHPTVWSIPQPVRCSPGHELGKTVADKGGQVYPASPGSYLPARIRRLTHP